jgi:alpha-glucosidase
MIMSDFLWWRDGVVYQIYPRSFADSNDDGLGDLPGITARLDYLAELGVDALWLSPIYPSPMHDFGYDVSDYENIDPIFGTLQDFDQLVAEAHRRGLRLVLDLVMNHTSHLHPWFVESRASRDNPRHDWYLWRDPAPDGGPPNNWQSIFGGSGWELDPAIGQYYYHQFLVEQPDLNWRNPAVRERLYQMMRFWLERGVDGFRLDVVMSYFKDEQFRSNPTTPFGLRAFDRQKHIYDWDQPEMALALRDIRQVLDAYPERMAVGEVDGLDMAVRFVGDEKLHLAFNFAFTRQPWRPRALQKAILDYADRLPDGAWPCYVLGNHDVSRFPTRFGGGPHSDARTKAAATLLLTLRGTPFIYYGEELGMQNTRLSREEIQDPPGKRYWPFFLGRDPERTPMQWDGEINAGFTNGAPWLRLNPDYRQRNVVAQQADANSVLNFYKQLLRLRKESPALRRGSFTALLKQPTEVLAYLRQTPEQTLLVALNFYGWSVNVKLDEALPEANWELRLTSTPGGPYRRALGQHLTLAPFEACVLEAA